MPEVMKIQEPIEKVGETASLPDVSPYREATIAVTITVTNIDEPGTVALSRATPAVGRSLTATLTDPDGGVTGAIWTWAWSTTRTGSFTTISGASAPTYTPASGDLGRYLKASVSYSDSFGSGKNAEMTSTNAVVANPPPVFPNASVTFTVHENATSGRVGRVRATDPDGETITYSVGGVDVAAFNEDFSLNSSTGVIRVKSSHPTGSHGWRNQFDLGNPG